MPRKLQSLRILQSLPILGRPNPRISDQDSDCSTPGDCSTPTMPPCHHSTIPLASLHIIRNHNTTTHKFANMSTSSPAVSPASGRTFKKRKSNQHSQATPNKGNNDDNAILHIMNIGVMDRFMLGITGRSAIHPGRTACISNAPINFPARTAEIQNRAAFSPTLAEDHPLQNTHHIYNIVAHGSNAYQFMHIPQVSAHESRAYGKHTILCPLIGESLTVYDNFHNTYPNVIINASAARTRVNTNPIDYIHEPADDENPESYILPDPKQYYFLYHTLIQTDELWNPIIADGEDQESAISFTTPQFARLQALCEYLQRPLRNLQAPQDPASAEDAQ